MDEGIPYTVYAGINVSYIWICLDDMDMDDMDVICRVCKLDKIQGRPRIEGHAKTIHRRRLLVDL